MIFVAKSAPTVEGLTDKRDKGFNKIEIQLTKNAEHQDFDNITFVSGIDVVGVHTPLISDDNGSKEDVAIEYITKDRFNISIIQTCELAHELAMYYNHEIYIVLHNSFSKYQYENIPTVLGNIKSEFSSICKRYPMLKFYIENVSPVTRSDMYRNGVYLEDTKYIVDELNKLYAGRFGITFDTCHMMMSELMYNKYIHNNEVVDESNYQIKQFGYKYIFETFGSSIKNIHLNNIIGCGTSEKTHGTPFLNCERDKDILIDFFNNYSKYNCDSFITLEIREEDYNNCKNIVSTRGIIKEIIGI